MRIYIIGNDGITLSRTAPAALNEGEIVVASNAELHAAPLNGKQLLALWNALPGVEKRRKVGFGATPAIRSRSRDGSGGPTAAVSRRSCEAVQVVAHPTGSTLRHATSAYPQLRVVPPAERHNRWIAGKPASARLFT